MKLRRRRSRTIRLDGRAANSFAAKLFAAKLFVDQDGVTRLSVSGLTHVSRRNSGMPSKNARVQPRRDTLDHMPPSVVPGREIDPKEGLRLLTEQVGKLAGVVSSLVTMAADETLPATRAGTSTARERAQALRQGLETCATVNQEIAALARQLED